MNNVERFPAHSFGVLVLTCIAIGVVFAPSLLADDYVGVKKCRVCHMEEFRAWEQTKMAKVFELLKPGAAAEIKKAHKLDPDKDYTKDATCLQCHTTGYGKGGFTSIEATPDLAGVTCEACHGPGGGYLKPELMSLSNKEFKRADVQAAGLVIPDVKTCENCHNEKSPFFQPFDFEKRKVQGTHQHFELKYKH